MLFRNLQEFTCKLYCSQPGTDNINELRYWLFFAKKLPRDTTPIGFGWREDGDHFAIDWMNGDPASTAVLELLSCPCTRSCQLPTSSCLANGLKCTDVCKLLDYDNRCEDSIQEFVSDNREEDVQAVSYILNNYSYLTFGKFSHGNHPGTISLS